MSPRTRPLPVPSEAKLSPENARRVREGIEQAERGEFADLTERWLDSHASTDVT